MFHFFCNNSYKVKIKILSYCFMSVLNNEIDFLLFKPSVNFLGMLFFVRNSYIVTFKILKIIRIVLKACK